MTVDDYLVIGIYLFGWIMVFLFAYKAFLKDTEGTEHAHIFPRDVLLLTFFLVMSLWPVFGVAALIKKLVQLIKKSSQ